MSLGIGATTAVFTVVKSVLLVPLPMSDPERVVVVKAVDLDAPDEPSAFSPPSFQALHDQSEVFAAMAAWRGTSFILVDEGAAERVSGMRVSGEFFRVMDNEAVVGRLIEPADDRPGGSASSS